jgi:hypothetical protein
MKNTHVILILTINLVNLVKVSVQYSYAIEGSYLFELDRGCKNVDIRFDAGYLEKLNFCKTVHGFLRISDLNISPELAESTSFSELREITGYFLFENVQGIKSLSSLFPNLQAIRGEILHHDFALVITHASDLENIGLVSLTYVANGNVRLENNANLSYIDTIDWKRLRNDIMVINKVS